MILFDPSDQNERSRLKEPHSSTGKNSAEDAISLRRFLSLSDSPRLLSVVLSCLPSRLLPQRLLLKGVPPLPIPSLHLLTSFNELNLSFLPSPHFVPQKRESKSKPKPYNSSPFFSSSLILFRFEIRLRFLSGNMEVALILWHGLTVWRRRERRTSTSSGSCARSSVSWRNSGSLLPI